VPVSAPDAARTIPKVAADISQLPRKSPTPPIIESMLEINPRFYIGASGGMSTLDTGISNTTGTAKLDEDDSGFKFYGGVNLNKIFGLEAHYADFGERSLSGNPGDRFDFEGKTLQFKKSATITTEEASYGLAATAGYDVTRWFRPFAKFGGHRWNQEGEAVASTATISKSHDGIGMFFGAGVQSRIYKGLSIRAEFERFQFDDPEEIDFFSAGMNYQF
jgi:OOP family OmpA-OmpF porin|tara:strand:- start:133 stop:789 length:657 start_codon:yes stop_codon:yes gene_type:complete